MESCWSLVGDRSLETPVLLSFTESAADIYVNWTASGKAKQGNGTNLLPKEDALRSHTSLSPGLWIEGTAHAQLCLPQSAKAIQTVLRYGSLLR